MDTEDTVYDTEVQKEDTRNLPKRSRLYQGLIDTKLLDPGEVDFNQMNDVYTIIITPFDIFGKGLYCYTFRMKCDEDTGLILNDGATRIFLNTHGTNPEGVTPELLELLRYIEHTTEEVSNACQSDKIRELQRRIAAIKSSEVIGVKYMQEWEEKIIEKRKAREEGLAEGRAEGRMKGRAEGRSEGAEYKVFSLVRKKMAKGCGVEEIAEILEEDAAYIREIFVFLRPRMDETEDESWAEWTEVHQRVKE